MGHIPAVVLAYKAILALHVAVHATDNKLHTAARAYAGTHLIMTARLPLHTPLSSPSWAHSVPSPASWRHNSVVTILSSPRSSLP